MPFGDLDSFEPVCPLPESLEGKMHSVPGVVGDIVYFRWTSDSFWLLGYRWGAYNKSTRSFTEDLFTSGMGDYFGHTDVVYQDRLYVLVVPPTYGVPPDPPPPLKAYLLRYNPETSDWTRINNGAGQGLEPDDSHLIHAESGRAHILRDGGGYHTVMDLSTGDSDTYAMPSLCSYEYGRYGNTVYTATTDNKLMIYGLVTRAHSIVDNPYATTGWQVVAATATKVFTSTGAVYDLSTEQWTQTSSSYLWYGSQSSYRRGVFVDDGMVINCAHSSHVEFLDTEYGHGRIQSDRPPESAWRNIYGSWINADKTIGYFSPYYVMQYNIPPLVFVQASNLTDYGVLRLFQGARTNYLKHVYQDEWLGTYTGIATGDKDMPRGWNKDLSLKAFAAGTYAIELSGDGQLPDVFSQVLVAGRNRINRYFNGGGAPDTMIDTPEKFFNIIYGPSQDYQQAADIDFTLIADWWCPGAGAAFQPFAGEYDGQGHTLRNIYARPDVRDSIIGTFLTEAAGTAIFRNIRIEDVSIESEDVNRIGLLVAQGRTDVAGQRATFEDCHVKGSAVGSYSVAGLIAAYPGIMRRCSFEGTVEVVDGGYYCGGLVGLGDGNTLLEQCYAIADATGFSEVGALVGDRASARNCYARGTVTAENPSFAWYIGGLIGGLYAPDNYVENCYAACVVTATGARAGGLIGYIDSSGGLGVTASYYDSQVSGQSDTGKGEPRTTAEMTYPADFDTTYIDWDFHPVTGIWTIKDGWNAGYPYFRVLAGLLIWAKRMGSYRLVTHSVKRDGVYEDDHLVYVKVAGHWQLLEE